MRKKPTAIIVGPAEKIEQLGHYMPRAIIPPCESASPHVPGGSRYTKEECDAVLDAFAQKHRDRGVRVIRVHTMEERDAILTFVRQSVESLAGSVALSVRLYGHEDAAT